jgi:hypothetical protein
MDCEQNNFSHDFQDEPLNMFTSLLWLTCTIYSDWVAEGIVQCQM